MSYAQRHVVTVTTDANGAATSYTDVVTGTISHLVYVKGNCTNGVGFTITAEATAEPIVTLANCNASTIVAPRQPLHDANGAALLYAAGGKPLVDVINLARDRVKIVTATGGSGTTGTFHVVIQ